VTRVLVADDHPVVRQGLEALLTSLGHEVVALATNGADAVREAVLTKPDVVLLDLQMPGTDGLTALRELARVAPRVPVCVLTLHDDDETVFAAVRAGARGYLLKGAEQQDIDRAVRGLAAGEAVFGAGVAERVLVYFRDAAGVSGAARKVELFPELSAREREVLELLSRGHSYAHIARELGVSAKTVSNNVSAILQKLQVADRAQAALRARDAGMGSG
jgi:DNA-binding NarL/FixJ family response regulator